MNIALIFHNLDLSLATLIPPAHQTPTYIYTVTAEEMNTAYAKSALKYMQSFLYIKKVLISSSSLIFREIAT